MAIAGGRVLAVGRREEIRALAGPDTRIDDHGEAAILPAFRDAHVHLVPTGLATRRLVLRGLDLDGIRAAVAERTRTTPPGARIDGAGFALADLGIVRPPCAADLDDVAPDHPVRLASHDLHALWLNTRALEDAGRPADAPSYVTEDEVRLYHDAAGREGPEEILAAARAADAAFVRAGISRMQDHGRLAELTAILRLANEGALRVRVDFSIRHHELPRYLAERERWPDVPGRVRVNGMKLFLDGALGSRTAWTLEPYLDSGGTGHRTHSRETAKAAVRLASEAGMPTFFHAIGDAAVREALDLIELFPGLPHRVEHAQLIHPDDRPRFARLDVAASMQPVHLLTDTPTLIARWGEERSRRSFPARSLLESGAELLLGTDSPIESYRVTPGIFAATERRTLDDRPLPGDEAISREAAFAAYGSGVEVRAGAIAELTIWDDDPRTADPEELPGLSPASTILPAPGPQGGTS